MKLIPFSPSANSLNAINMRRSEAQFCYTAHLHTTAETKGIKAHCSWSTGGKFIRFHEVEKLWLHQSAMNLWRTNVSGQPISSVVYLVVSGTDLGFRKNGWRLAEKVRSGWWCNFKAFPTGVKSCKNDKKNRHMWIYANIQNLNEAAKVAHLQSSRSWQWTAPKKERKTFWIQMTFLVSYLLPITIL